jgi:GntR family transcriptional regulator
MVYRTTNTIAVMFFKLSQTVGQPLYLQLMQQVRHAIENGVLAEGDQLPSIRSAAEELVVSPATIVKAYTELEREGVLVLQQGAGAFVSRGRVLRSSSADIQAANARVSRLVEQLLEKGISEQEIRRIFEAALLNASTETEKR